MAVRMSAVLGGAAGLACAAAIIVWADVAQPRSTTECLDERREPIACVEPHLYEVIERIPLPERLAEDPAGLASDPRRSMFALWAATSCEQATARAVGSADARIADAPPELARVHPTGAFEPASWLDLAHTATLVCAARFAEPVAMPTGAGAGDLLASSFPAGARRCLGPDSFEPVRCRGPHAIEVLAAYDAEVFFGPDLLEDVSHRFRAGDGIRADEQDAFDGGCRDLLSDAVDPPEGRRIAATLSPHSFQDPHPEGRYLIWCGIAAADPGGLVSGTAFAR